MSQPLVAERSERTPIEVVHDSASQVHGTQHVPERGPVRLSFRQQVRAHVPHRGLEVLRRELVGLGPADDPVAAAGDQDGVHEGDGEEKAAVDGRFDDFELVGVEGAEGAEETGANALRGLVGDVEGALKKPGGELVMRGGGDPKHSPRAGKSCAVEGRWCSDLLLMLLLLLIRSSGGGGGFVAST